LATPSYLVPIEADSLKTFIRYSITKRSKCLPRETLRKERLMRLCIDRLHLSLLGVLKDHS
jgi:hypothetical protein